MAEESRTFLQDSGWEYVTSEGRDANVGGKTFSLAVAQGSIYVAPHLAKDDPYELNYKSVGGSAGVSISPISYDLATKDMQSAGVIYANPLRISGATLTLDDMTGAYLAYGISVSDLVGRSWTVMFFGVGLGLATSWLAAMSGVGAALAPAIVISSCHASIWFWSDLIATTPGATVTGSLGYISVASR